MQSEMASLVFENSCTTFEYFKRVKVIGQNKLRGKYKCEFRCSFSQIRPLKGEYGEPSVEVYTTTTGRPLYCMYVCVCMCVECKHREIYSLRQNAAPSKPDLL